MKIYVSGPMSGRPNLNEPAFREARRFIERVGGHEAVLPHEVAPYRHEGKKCPKSYADGQDGHGSACYLRTDLIEMLAECDAVYMLADWESSVGARLEHSVAAASGMPIYYEYCPKLYCDYSPKLEKQKKEPVDYGY